MNGYTPKNILITGGAGFIGINFIKHLLSKTDAIKIYNLDLLTYAANHQVAKALQSDNRYTLIHGSITDHTLLKIIFDKHHIDTVVHFAAESHVDRSIVAPQSFIDTNIIGTFWLLETAKLYWSKAFNLSSTHCRFHHISTDEVFGSLPLNAPSFTEKSPYQPNSPYSASKASADHLVRAYYETYNVPSVTTNCSNNYGPYQNIEKLIPKIIHACLNNKQIPIYGDGENIRDWLFVNDHCKMIESVLKNGTTGETYNLGGETEVTNNFLVKKICGILDEITPAPFPYENLTKYVKDRPGHDKRYAINNNKIKDCGLLNFQLTPLDIGLKKTIQYYMNK